MPKYQQQHCICFLNGTRVAVVLQREVKIILFVVAAVLFLMLFIVQCLVD